MKRGLIFLGLIVWAGSIPAQTINLTSKLDFINLQFYDVKYHEQSIYISAYGQDSLLPNNTKFLILKFDLKGNLRKSFSFYDDSIGVNFFSFENSLEISRNKIIARAHVDGNITGYRICYLQLDTNLNLLKTNYQPITGFKSIYSYSTIVTDKNSIYSTGGLQKNNFDVDVFIQKLDSNLNQIWYKNIGTTSKYERGHSIIELSNGNLLIGAHRTDAGMTVAGQRFKEQTWIFEIDTAGNMLREFLDTNTRTGPAKGLTQTNDGGFVYCGKKQAYWDGHLTHLYENSLTKIDQSLNNIVWEKTFSDTISNVVGLNNIVYSGKNEIIAFGTQPVRFGFTFGYDFSGLIVNYDQNGNKKWERNFRNEDSLKMLADNEFFGGIINDEGELIFVGRSEFRNGGPSKGWVLKLDSDGCYDNGFCGYPIVSVKEQVNYENKDFEFYPNPVKETLFINTHEGIEYLKIYNTLGQLVVEQKFPPNQVSLSSLRSGLYFMNVKTATGVFTKKFVKE